MRLTADQRDAFVDAMFQACATEPTEDPYEVLGRIERAVLEKVAGWLDDPLLRDVRVPWVVEGLRASLEEKPDGK